jgi:N utilization substance protein B
VVHGRREARERALELLYEAETKQTSCSAIVDALPVAPDPYATTLATGVDDDRAAIDSMIRDHAKGWTLERMPAVDRAVLRMATYELLHCPDVPVAVAISEAVELAQQFSTDESGRFVNGLLSAVAKQTRPHD